MIEYNQNVGIYWLYDRSEYGALFNFEDFLFVCIINCGKTNETGEPNETVFCGQVGICWDIEENYRSSTVFIRNIVIPVFAQK